MSDNKKPEVQSVSKKDLNKISGGANVKTEYNDSDTISRTIGETSNSNQK